MPTINCQHIFFDLDHTLWDFTRNSSETLLELYQEFDLGVLTNESPETFLEAFRLVNAELWSMYNRNKIEKFYIRTKRFPLVLSRLGVEQESVSEKLGELYLARCPKKQHLLPYTEEILNYLKPKYQLHIISNGFSDVQELKLRNSGIFNYFQVVINSESIGHKKPHRKVFEHALEQAKAPINQSLMIGDNLKTDIQGAKNIGMQHIFYNPNKLEHFQQVNFEINHLQELEDLL